MRRRWALWLAFVTLLAGGCLGPDRSGETGSTGPPPAPPPALPVGTLEWIAQIPSPGQPIGLAFKDGLAYLSTFGVEQTDPDEFIFVVDVANESVRGSIRIPAEAPATTMGLLGLAFGPDDALYAVDMNGRIVRVVAPWDPANATLSVWARWPQSAPGIGAIPAPMPMDVAFAADGRAYVVDLSLPVIWRVGATGSPVERWLVDPRITGGEQARIIGNDLWYMVTTPDSTLFRIPIQDTVGPDDAVVVHAWNDDSYAFGFIRGAENMTYVAHRDADEVSVLDERGDEIRRFLTPTYAQVPFDNPGQLAFDAAGRLLVANTAWAPASERADHMGLLGLTVTE